MRAREDMGWRFFTPWIHSRQYCGGHDAGKRPGALPANPKPTVTFVSWLLIPFGLLLGLPSNVAFFYSLSFIFFMFYFIFLFCHFFPLYFYSFP